MMIITIAVVRALLRSTSHNCFSVSSLYMNMLTRTAYQTAIAPASVGVKTPENMPPQNDDRRQQGPDTLDEGPLQFA